jgi:integrase/recombinase XerD
VPCHHSLDEYLAPGSPAAGIGDDKKGPLFRTFKQGDKLTGNPMIRSDILYMMKPAGQGSRPPLLHLLPYFSRDRYYRLSPKRGHLGHAQQIAVHQSPRTTKLYNRTRDEIRLMKWNASNFKLML